MSFMPAYITFY